MSSVVQEWLTNSGLKMQSIFLNGLRAPDAKTKGVKAIVRWMRTVSCYNADPAKADCYMSAPPVTEDLVETALDELEYLSCHYVHHLADALRIVSLYHPEDLVRLTAWKIHFNIAEEIFHFKPETNNEFELRHRDKTSERSAAASPLKNS
jgi:hypothetical protein